MSNQPKIVVILGPTAAGKSDLSIKLAKKYNGEIVSADSRQIYREMNIGTAKPAADLPNSYRIKSNKSRIANSVFGRNSLKFVYHSSGIPHHLIDIKNPNEEYSAAEYKADCLKIIYEILKKKKLPILVGGTGLYIKAVIGNLKIPEVRADKNLRQKLEETLKEHGVEHLYNQLIKLDPEAAYIIDPKNPRRVIRALEITLLSNKPFSEQREKGGKLFDALEIGINIPNTRLRKKIERRVDLMMQNGLLEEVKNLIKQYPLDTPAFDAIGYRELIGYFKFKKSLKEAVEEIKENTWHYAKRQLTWFRADREIKWIKNTAEAERLLRRFVRA